MNRFIIFFLFLFTSRSAISQDASIKAIDINMSNVDYPYPVRFITVTNQGETLRMAYMDVQPEKANGKNVVLMHGKNFSGAYWQTTIQELTKNGFRVIVPDQVGFGKSGKPSHLQYTFQLLAQNTRALLDSLHITHTAILGHSMGGMLATRFTLMYPQMIEKLILENPLGLEDWKRKLPYQSVDDWYKSELKQNYNTLKKYQQDNYYGGNWKPEYEKWVALSAGMTISDDYPKMAWNSALTYDMIFTQPVLYEFELVNAPTLLIIGQSDRTALGKNLVPEALRNTMGNYPEMGRQTAKKIKGARLVEIENTGHLPHIQSFEKFIVPLIKFLSE